MGRPTLAVDLGGTHMRAAVVDPGGGVQHRVEQPTPHDGRGTEALVALIDQTAAEHQAERAVVGVPGRVDYQVGALEYAPNLPPGWLAGLTEAALTAQVGVPVALANDADLAAVGEAWFGAGRGKDDVVYITFSTGVGAGVVLARRLLHGRRSIIEIGHTVVSSTGETLEQLASGTALGRRGADEGYTGGGPQVISAARDGDDRAAGVLAQVAQAAAVGVVNLAWLFAPEIIVVGGGLGLIGELMLAPMRSALERSGPPAVQPPIEVVNAGLGDDAGLIGAAAWQEAFVPEAAGRPPSGEAFDRAPA